MLTLNLKPGVVNYPNTYKFTRITEFTKITQQVIDKTTVCKEYPSWTGEKSYPVPTDKDRVILDKYHKEVSKLSNVFFLGRLGEYKYINMDQAVEGALDLHKRIKDLY